MDGDDRPRDAGNAGAANGPWVSGGKIITPAWYDDPSLTPVQMTVTNSDGTTSAVDMTVAEWVRMADSHADLIAALEGTLDCLVYIDDNFPEFVGNGVRHRRAAAARAALAKANGTPPAPMTRAEEAEETDRRR